ncbi:hypothetical protein O3W44_22595 [Pantoea sp. LMR881]|uniref:hypothetical protein n=1 Tax=Pantoea sp. LMR881 TaxID=3014336 RepID=UPI0022B05317|nr:hypothetical protein [Pantoea sp. LMR881]MCZ4061212.1 hypothetical protein [Pantoea sp. LMR881]MCZ4061324.1 hypothetical protein [Pantoea sp. LMR881]
MALEWQIAKVEILDANGSYLKKGTILPVFIDEDGDVSIREDFEAGEPVIHMLDDLRDDGVRLKMKPIVFEQTDHV